MALIITLTVGFALQLIALSALLVVASQIQSRGPPIYVAQHQPNQHKHRDQSPVQWVHAPASGTTKLWANQKSVARQFGRTQVSPARSAKQMLFYADQIDLPNLASYQMDFTSANRMDDLQLLGKQPSDDNFYLSDNSWLSSAEPGAQLAQVHLVEGTKSLGKSGTRRRVSSRRQPESNMSSKSPSVGSATKGQKSPANRNREHHHHHHPNPHQHHNHQQHHHEAPTLARKTPIASSTGNATSTRLAPTDSKGTKKLVCYYGTWAVYRPDAGRYPVENIDPFLCTHIIYGFAGLSFDNLIKPLDPWNDLEDNYGKGAMKRFTNLKRINPDLKTLIAIGGWNEGSIKYSKMASDPEARGRFVRSVVEFIERYNFDGLDLDWEYPGSRGGASYDKQNFVKLLRELHDAFAPRNYLLTAAVSAGKWFVDPAYDIPQVSKYLDLINLMAYDYHGGWETKTGHNAPLFSSKEHDLAKDEALLNVNWSVNYWLQMGASPEKLMLGVGSYGRSFTLDKANQNGINAPASQKGQAGPYTREPGSLGYNEICESFQRQPSAWTIVRDPDYLAPYAYNDRQWVGYDDMESLALKAQFAKSMGLGGMMMWSIETDDFQGRCHNEKYPLLNTIKRVLAGDQVPTSTGSGSGSGSSSGQRPAPPSRPAGPSGTTQRPTTPRPVVTPPRPGIEIEEDPKPAMSTTRRPASARPNSSMRPSTSTSASTSTSTSTTTTTTTTSTTRQPIRPGPSGGNNNNNNNQFSCTDVGMFADPRNCRKFIRCVSSGGYQHFVSYNFDCGPGTAFNEAQQYCDHIYNVPNCAARYSGPNSNSEPRLNPNPNPNWNPKLSLNPNQKPERDSRLRPSLESHRDFQTQAEIETEQRDHHFEALPKNNQNSQNHGLHLKWQHQQEQIGGYHWQVSQEHQNQIENHNHNQDYQSVGHEPSSWQYSTSYIF